MKAESRSPRLTPRPGLLRLVGNGPLGTRLPLWYPGVPLGSSGKRQRNQWYKLSPLLVFSGRNTRTLPVLRVVGDVPLFGRAAAFARSARHRRPRPARGIEMCKQNLERRCALLRNARNAIAKQMDQIEGERTAAFLAGGDPPPLPAEQWNGSICSTPSGGVSVI